MKQRQRNVRIDIRHAMGIWPTLSCPALQMLRTLIQQTRLSVAAGDLIYLQNGWYITHTGLLHLARAKRCRGIDVAPVPEFCSSAEHRWSFKATVYKSRACRGFVGYGDADPSNVSPQVRGAEMRVAETRAVNRALRKAYGIGICSIEELGSFNGPLPTAGQMKNCAAKGDSTNGDGHHPLRDRLCLLIRQHRLDPALVKSYAADYLDLCELRQASREQVAKFISHLSEYAQHDREGLLCHLNSYAEPAPAEALVQIKPVVVSDTPDESQGAA